MKSFASKFFTLASCVACAFIPAKAALPSFDVHSSGMTENAQVAKYPSTPFKDFGSDAPWVHRAGINVDIPVITFIKDANQDSVLLDYVAYIREDTGQILAAYDPVPDTTISEPYWWLRLRGLTPAFVGLSYGDTLQLRVEIRFRDQLIWHNYTQNFQIKIAQPWPSLSGWYRGDSHHHSWYTQNTFEFGSELEFDADAAKDIGLSWVTLTEHSYDVTAPEWTEMKTRTTALSSANFRLLPGLEFSVDDDYDNDSVDNRIHLLAYGLQNWIAGPDIVPSFDVHADQPRTLPAVLADIAAQGGVAYAAHPESDSIPIDVYGFLPPWNQINHADARASTAFAGYQIFNQRPTSFDNTDIQTNDIDPFPWTPKTGWDAEWMRGIATYQNVVKSEFPKKIFMLGGSDAHGDANYTTFNAQGAFNIAANETAYGKMHTALYLPNGLQNVAVVDALKKGKSISTDGPLGAFDIRNSQGVTVASIADTVAYADDLSVHINAVTSTEFGNLSKAIIHVLAKNDERHINVPLSGLQATTSKSLGTLGISAPYAVWVETQTQLGYRSFANPIWVYPTRVCGDADGSGAINITDAVYLINYIFASGPEPFYGDADGSGAINITDAVYLINYIFAGGPAPVCTAK